MNPSPSEGERGPPLAAPLRIGAAIGTEVAIGAAVGGGVTAATEPEQTVEADARRTADGLAKRLAQFFAAQGWIAKDQAK